MLTKTTPICIGGSTYGYFNPKTNNFSCSHGAWDCKATLFDEDNICLHMSHIRKPYPFVIIDKIPEDYLR